MENLTNAEQKMRAGFFDAVGLMRQLYNRSLESVCIKFGMTRMELDVLLFLANNPEFDTASDIVELRGLSKSHVSTSVAGLEKRGYLERNHRSGNRRTVHLKLKADAEAAVEAGRLAQRRFFTVAFRGISLEDREAMERSFEKMAENVREILWEE